MNNDSIFKNINPNAPIVPVFFDGIRYELPAGMNLAAALLAADVISFRKVPVTRSARGPFCMMGACYDCIVKIDGVTQQACMTQVSERLVVERVKIPELQTHD